MYKFLPLLLLLVVAFSSCEIDDLANNETPTEQLLSRDQINQTLYQEIERNGTYNWSVASDELLWSAAMQSDSIFAIGFQPAGFQNIETEMHRIDLNAADWQAAQEQILQLILDGERAIGAATTREDLLPLGEAEVLPNMAVHFTNPATVGRLRVMSEVRYLEAMGYELPALNAPAIGRSDSGCGSSPNYNLNAADYTTIAPNVKQSWHHATSNVSQAWQSSTGDNVTIAIIDTGVSDDQENLGSQFNAGYSNGRTVNRASTLYSGRWWWRKLTSPDDGCGHGTSMSGLATAPRGTDGNAVGVAYNADLLSIRAVEDVIISSSNEKDGVKDALILAGNNPNVRVISMSIGSPFYSGTVADGIYYAYNQGKFITAAAGTSLSWTTWYGVIFPATMTQTVAVTGVRDGSNMEKCNTCHEGSAVDFVMVMQRAANTDRTTLSLALDTDQPNYVGGSSAATASVAGIAALVFANYPNATRQQVYNALRDNGNFYPNRDSDFGWGVIDAASAVSDPL